jgi:hypothetical protein
MFIIAVLNYGLKTILVAAVGAAGAREISWGADPNASRLAIQGAIAMPKLSIGVVHRRAG